MNPLLWCRSVKVTFHRYVVLVAGIYLMSVSGSNYLFAVLAGDLQNRFGYTNTQIELIGTLGNIGAWVSIIGGFIYDKYGPRKTSLIASVIVFLGYFLIYLACVVPWFTSNYIVLGICLALVGQGSGWTYTVALATTAKNFPSEDRGIVVGLLVCFYGLCGGIYTEIYRGFFRDVPTFILFMSITFSLVILVFGMISNVVQESTNKTEYRRFVFACTLSLVIAIYLGIINILTNKIPFIYTSLPLLFFLSWFVTVAVFHVDYFAKCEIVHPEMDVSVECASINGNNNNGNNNKSLLQSLKTLEFWIVFGCFFLNIGAGITTVNNLSNIVISRDHVPITNPPSHISTKDIPQYGSINTFVILFSVFNTLGRMFTGVLSDRFRFLFERETLLLFFTGLMMVTQIFMAFATIDMIYFGVIILGVAYGGIFCIIPVLVSELFGLTDFGANWAAMSVAPALGSLVFSTGVAGGLTDHFSHTSKLCVLSPKGLCSYVCVGDDCFKITYLVLFGSGIVAFVLNIIIKVILIRRRREQNVIVCD